MKHILSILVIVLQVTLSTGCSAPEHSLEETGPLSNIRLGMTKEQVIELVDEEESFTLINNQIEFFKDWILTDKEDSFRLKLHCICQCEFRGDRLVGASKTIVDTKMNEEACRELNRAFVNIYTERLGKPTELNHESMYNGRLCIKSIWEMDDMMFMILTVPAINSAMLGYYTNEYAPSAGDSNLIGIANLWFGIVELEPDGSFEKIKDTRQIPLDTTISFALLFDINSPDEVSIKLGHYIPSRMAKVVDAKTGKEVPKDKGFWIMDYGKFRNRCEILNRLDYYDPLGKYKIKIYLNDELVGMITFGVVPVQRLQE